MHLITSSTSFAWFEQRWASSRYLCWEWSFLYCIPISTSSTYTQKRWKVWTPGTNVGKNACIYMFNFDYFIYQALPSLPAPAAGPYQVAPAGDQSVSDWSLETLRCLRWEQEQGFSRREKRDRRMMRENGWGWRRIAMATSRETTKWS